MLPREDSGPGQQVLPGIEAGRRRGPVSAVQRAVTVHPKLLVSMVPETNPCSWIRCHRIHTRSRSPVSSCPYAPGHTACLVCSARDDGDSVLKGMLSIGGFNRTAVGQASKSVIFRSPLPSSAGGTRGRSPSAHGGGSGGHCMAVREREPETMEMDNSF